MNLIRNIVCIWPCKRLLPLDLQECLCYGSLNSIGLGCPCCCLVPTQQHRPFYLMKKIHRDNIHGVIDTPAVCLTLIISGWTTKMTIETVQSAKTSLRENCWNVVFDRPQNTIGAEFKLILVS